MLISAVPFLGCVLLLYCSFVTYASVVVGVIDGNLNTPSIEI